MDGFWHIVAGVMGYFLGSLPTGYLVGRARGLDIRTTGSGNIGATNVFRTLGKRAGVWVLGVDALKGWAACGIGTWWAGQGSGSSEVGAIVGGVAAILGHNYPCWLRFRGGKGIATSAGVLVALVPGALTVCLGVWLTVLALTRYVSLASVASALGLPLAVALWQGSVTMIGITAAMSVLAIYKHKANLRRLWLGTEPRFVLRRPPSSTQSSP